MKINNDTYICESFNDKNSADRAFVSAVQVGYKPEEINIMMSENTKALLNSHDTAEKEAVQGVAVGSIVGGTIGGTIGALIAFGSNIALPGLGVILAGPLMGAGSVSGGLLGSLFGWSLPNEEKLPNSYDLPNAFKESLKNGSIILVVKENLSYKSIKPIWESIKLSTSN